MGCSPHHSRRSLKSARTTSEHVVQPAERRLIAKRDDEPGTDIGLTVGHIEVELQTRIVQEAAVPVCTRPPDGALCELRVGGITEAFDKPPHRKRGFVEAVFSIFNLASDELRTPIGKAVFGFKMFPDFGVGWLAMEHEERQVSGRALRRFRPVEVAAARQQ